MSRLEEIKVKYKNIVNPDKWKNGAPLIVVAQDDMEWIVNRVEELEEDKNYLYELNLEMGREFWKMIQENKHYKQALETISEHATDDLDNYVTRYLDFKFIARQALEGDSK